MLRRLCLCALIFAFACGDDDNNPVDSSVRDSASADSGSADSGSADSGSVDSGSVDSGSVDSGSVDSGSVDSGSVDASIDAAQDASMVDANEPDAAMCLKCAEATLACTMGDGCPENNALCAERSRGRYTNLKSCLCLPNVCGTECRRTCTGSGVDDDCAFCMRSTVPGACAIPLGDCQADF